MGAVTSIRNFITNVGINNLITVRHFFKLLDAVEKFFLFWSTFNTLSYFPSPGAKQRTAEDVERRSTESTMTLQNQVIIHPT